MLGSFEGTADGMTGTTGATVGTATTTGAVVTGSLPSMVPEPLTDSSVSMLGSNDGNDEPEGVNAKGA
jgi:hypothetical protein